MGLTIFSATTKYAISDFENLKQKQFDLPKISTRNVILSNRGGQHKKKMYKKNCNLFWKITYLALDCCLSQSNESLLDIQMLFYLSPYSMTTFFLTINQDDIYMTLDYAFPHKLCVLCFFPLVVIVKREKT